MQTQPTITRAPFVKKAMPTANPKKRKLATQGYVKRVMSGRIEKKLFDLGVGDVAVNTTGAFQLLNGLVRGTGLYGERVGAQITMDSIEISGKVGHNGYMGAANATATQQQVARLIVVRDKQTNGAIFSLTDLLDTATANALYQGDWLGRYEILLDKRWVCPSMTTDASGNPSLVSQPGGVHAFYFKIPCKRKVHYNNGNAGTVADIDQGSIYMLWVGDNAASVTAACTARVGVMAHYTDA